MSATLSLIRWVGGKGKQLRQLLPFIPDSRVYVEPFGGGASVLLNKPRSEVEVYNDLDESLINLFYVIRDPVQFSEFANLIGWTPYSRRAFEDSRDHESEPDAVLRAVKFYTVLNQSISGKRLATKSDWSRAKSANVAERWFLRQEKLGLLHERLKYVQIECRDALDILEEWDSPETVFYCDPPYVLDTRKKQKYYAVELDDEYHYELCERLKLVEGMVVLSGYNHPIYQTLMDHGWMADSYAEMAAATLLQKGEERDPRQEIVWRNPACVEYGIRRPLPLFVDSTAEDLPLFDDLGQIGKVTGTYTDDEYETLENIREDLI
jgi:DNA adenine methylase